jgi:hypothetical protein
MSAGSQSPTMSLAFNPSPHLNETSMRDSGLISESVRLRVLDKPNGLLGANALGILAARLGAQV